MGHISAYTNYLSSAAILESNDNNILHHTINSTETERSPDHSRISISISIHNKTKVCFANKWLPGLTAISSLLVRERRRRPTTVQEVVTEKQLVATLCYFSQEGVEQNRLPPAARVNFCVKIKEIESSMCHSNTLPAVAGRPINNQQSIINHLLSPPPSLPFS